MSVTELPEYLPFLLSPWFLKVQSAFVSMQDEADSAMKFLFPFSSWKEIYFPMVSLKMAVFLFFSFNFDSNCNSSLLKDCCGKRSVTSIWMYDAWQLCNGKIKKINISLIVVKTKNKTKYVLSLRCRHHYLKLMVSIIGVALSRLANSQFAICSRSKFSRIAKTSSGSKFWKIPW